MRIVRIIWLRIRSLWRRPALKREIDEELAFHIEARTAENVAAGLTPEEAARGARKRFGNLQSVREECRDVRGAGFGEGTWKDVRFAFRQLRRSPGFTTVAVISLALGIGANTAIFSVVKAVLLRSLPVPDAQELRVIRWSGTEPSVRNFTGNIETVDGRQVSATFQYPMFRDFQASAAGVADVFAFYPIHKLSTQTRGRVSISEGMMVSGNYFSSYGARAFVGRLLTPNDDRAEADPVAVITHRFWERHLGGDPRDALGKSVAINRRSFTIVGVLPRDHAGPAFWDAADLYVTMAAQPYLVPSRSLTSYDNWWALVMARVPNGTRDEALDSRLTAVFARGLEGARSHMDHPVINMTDGRRGIGLDRVVPRSLGALQGVVAVVLLIACVNLAGLMLARMAVRRREFAVCAAIGASRWRLIRRALVESALLALGGAALGLLCAPWIKASVLRFIPDIGSEMRLTAPIDGPVLLFTLSVTVAVAVLCGWLPAWRVSCVDPAVDLRGGRNRDFAHQTLGRALVIAQVSLSLLLVAAAGLFARSVVNLRAVNPGFQPENLLLFGLHADQTGFGEQQRIAYFDAVRSELARIPGVTAVALSDGRLVSGSVDMSGFTLPVRAPRPGEHWQALQLEVSDGYFKTMGIPLLAGRDFSSGDIAESQPVMIVNERFARDHFAGEDPIGRTVHVGSTDFRIIGVSGTTLYASVREDKPTTMYYAHRQRAPSRMNFIVRTALTPMSVLSAVRQAVASVDPTVPMSGIDTQTALFDRSLFVERMFAALCGSLGGLAVLLSCIGLYGLLAYNVARRTAEIGVRMALGARPGNVAGMIVREAFVMTLAGVAVGLPLAVGLGFAARQAFFGVSACDPVTMTATVTVLLLVAALAAWLPARRAARVDPMEALRCE